MLAKTPLPPHSYRSLAVLGPGEVAAIAESLKEKYTELLQFTSMAVDTSGVLGPWTLFLLGNWERRLSSFRVSFIGGSTVASKFCVVCITEKINYCMTTQHKMCLSCMAMKWVVHILNMKRILTAYCFIKR